MEEEIPIFEKIGDMTIPGSIRKKERILLRKAGVKSVDPKFYGFVIGFEILVSLFASIFFVTKQIMITKGVFFWLAVSPLIFIGLLFAMLIVAYLCYRVFLELKIYNRVREMEEYLPLFLEVLTINLKAGLNLNKALVNSTSTEFGALNDEIIHIIKESETGLSLEQAIMDFTKQYKSVLLSEVFELIITSYQEGGKTSYLTEMIVTNINNSNYLKKKVIASVMSYVIFISLVALILTPMLFSLSFNLLLLTQSLISKLVLGGSSGVIPPFLTRLNINNDDFIIFSRLTIALIALSASSIIAIIQKNSIKAGVKYLVMFVIISSLSFQFFLWIFTLLFKNIFNTIL